MMAPMSDTDATNDAPPGPTDHLVELQRLDTEIDQLGHRRERLPEAETLREAQAALAEWESTRTSLSTRIEQLGAEMTTAEERTAEIATDKARLEAQLKTVIAPREAEALMHEIATLDEELDAVETGELEALETQTQVEETLDGHLGQEAATRDAVDAAGAAASAAIAAIEEEIGGLTERRDASRAGVPAALQARYDRMRANHLVAVSQLNGRQCTGCHLDLSAAEVDDVKDEAARSDGVSACPQCGRMLVI